MGSFVVKGGNSLSGTLVPQGAKNEALQVICATLLTGQPVTIHNIPEILDVSNLISLLEAIGVQVDRKVNAGITFRAGDIRFEYLLSDDFKKRASA